MRNIPEIIPKMAEKVLRILGLFSIELSSIHSDLMLYICHAITDSNRPVRVNPSVKKGLDTGLVSVSEMKGM